MRIRISLVIIALAVGVSAARAQQEAPAPAVGDAEAAVQVAQCSQAQTSVAATIEAALKRLEEARQNNSAAQMRAVSDDLQTALLDLRTRLAPCADMRLPAGADPHAGHVTPSAEAVPPAAPGAPATPATQTAAPAAQAGPAAPRPPAAAARPPAAAAPAGRQTAAATALTIALRTTPSPARGAAANQFEVTVTDREGKPVEGASVSLQLYMPAMPAMRMPEMRQDVALTSAGNGRYGGSGQVAMAGAWTATVIVRQNGRETGRQTITVNAR